MHHQSATRAYDSEYTITRRDARLTTPDKGPGTIQAPSYLYLTVPVSSVPRWSHAHSHTSGTLQSCDESY